MTAAATAPPTTDVDQIEPTVELVQIIPVNQIEPSPYQNRTHGMSHAHPKLKELATSISRMGILQPVTVRPVESTLVGKLKNEPRYQLICGERRWRASILAGEETIPALVRPLNNEDALLAVVVENNQREDLTPLESAAGVQALLDAGYDVPAIAGKLGHDPSWVYRLAQLTKLTKAWKEEASEQFSEVNHRTHGPQINTWSIGHLEEVARLPAETQDRLLKIVQDGEFRRPNLEHLRHLVNDLTRQLGKAGFPLEEADLVRGVPSCANCPKREGTCSTLFGIEEDRPVDQDRCLDKKCYNRKVETHLRRQVKEVKTKHPEAIEVKKVEGYRYGDTPDFTSKGQGFVKAKKSDKDAVLAVVTSKSGAGQKVYVKPGSKRGGRATLDLNLKTLREGLGQYRWILALEILAEHLKALPWVVVSGNKATPMDLLRLLGAVDAWGDQQRWDDDPLTSSTTNAWAKKTDEEVQELVWDRVRGALLDKISLRDREKLADEMKETPVPHEYLSRQIPKRVGAARAVCGLFSLEWKGYLKEATAALPEPAEWKGLKASDVPGKPAAAAQASGAGKGKKASPKKGKAAAATDDDADPDIDEPDDRYEGEDHEEEDQLPDEAEEEAA